MLDERASRPLDPHRPRQALRPEIRARKHAISSGHYLATLAGVRMLDSGGNAVDAGVAAGLCLGILLSDFVSLGGVAPIMVYDAARQQAQTVAGVGHWPRAATLERFLARYRGEMPEGIPRTVVPAAPDAWIAALRRWGTRSFAEVAAAATELAVDGFPMYELMSMRITRAAHQLQAWPSTAAVFLPGGRPPRPGERFRQTEAASTLERMAAAEARACVRGRDAGLQAARDEFYRGETAERIANFIRQQDGLLDYDDLADYAVEIATPVSCRYREWQVYACGPWSQGPALAEALTILAGIDLRTLGHNSAPYLHTLIETLKLAFADREAYIGDPTFVNVPLETLLSSDYAAERRQQINQQRATPKLPAPGRIAGFNPPARLAVSARDASPASDTSYVCAVDNWGNVFSATPSDGFNTAVVPGVGITISPRGSQSWLDPLHPSVLAPGKRPRLTPNPAIALRSGGVLPLGTPGGDVQIQAMLQVFLNIAEFGLAPQAAVEAPRLASYSAPDSFWPHATQPGVVRAESRLDARVLAELAERGHRVESWPEWTWLAGAVCTILGDSELLSAAADPRREAYALGW